MEMSPCPAGMVQGMEDGLVWLMSRLSLPRQTDKDHSNLWNPGTVELGLSPAFSVTICTQPPCLQEWEQARSASPLPQMFVLSRGLAVNDFLQGGSLPGTRETKEHVELRDAARAGCHRPQSAWVPSPVALLRAPSLQGKREGGVQRQRRLCSPLPASPISPGGAGWDPALNDSCGWAGAHFQGVRVLAWEQGQLPDVLTSTEWLVCNAGA